MARRILAGIVLTSWLSATPVVADPAEVPITGPAAEDAALRQRAPGVPDDAALEAAGAVVGTVTIRTLDIFDPSKPEEDFWLFRAANALHPTTRERVVRRQLLFREGEPYDPRKIAESERLLRDAGYLYDAWIRLAAWDGKRVDVEVVTRDVWTLTIGAGFGRTGGENKTRIGIEDSNLFGTGKEITVRRTEDVDRTQVLYRYRDPNLGGSRWTSELAYADNSDGKERRARVSRPFYSLDTRWAAAGSWEDADREDTLWEAGEEVARFRHRARSAEVSGGFSRGVVRGRAVRFRSGLALQRDRFALVPDALAPSALPEARTLVYPFVGVEVVPDAFVRARDLDNVVRTEDLRLGTGWTARLGYSAPAFGGDRGRLVWRGAFRSAMTPGKDQLLVLAGSTSGRLETGGARDVTIGGSVRWYRRNFERHAFYVLGDATAASRLDADRQLLLGGDTGLRGYPLRFQSGDRRLLVTLEQRFYTDWHLLQLVHVGAAAFVDYGRAWFAGRHDLPRPWLPDVGVGLRVGSSRSAEGAMVHIDVSWALRAPDGVRRVQFSVETRESF